MQQKYVVFLHDRPIIFDENINIPDVNTNIRSMLFDIETTAVEFERFAADSSITQLYFCCNNTEEAFLSFSKLFKFIKAAGGIVYNLSGDILLIKRFDKWDLPKGKLEQEELPEIGAMREVTEETSVTGLSVIRKLDPTYHIFTTKKGNIALKETSWFEMKTDWSAQPVPQQEEDITEVRWVPKSQLFEFMHDSYASLRYLLHNAGLLKT